MVRHYSLISALALAVFAMAGCGLGQDGQRPPVVAEVDRLLLQTPEAASDFDRDGKNDGVEATVFLFRGDPPQQVLVGGSLRFDLYEGRIAAGDLAAARPLKTWNFSGEQLTHMQGHHSFWGWGYHAMLDWGPNAPATSCVTLTVRHVAPSGAAVMAEPVVLLLQGQ
jgi:hypothetical protein